MRYDNYNKAGRTRRFIIEKAAPLFNRQGYAATSLADLVRVTGLTKGSIYGNFKNKDEVALAAFQHNVGFVIKALRKKLGRADTSVDKLLAYPQTFRSIAKSVLANGGCPILNTSVDSSGIHIDLHQAVSTIITAWKQSIISIIEQGIRDQEFSETINPASTAEVLMSLVEGGFAMAGATGDTCYLDSALDHMVRIIGEL